MNKLLVVVRKVNEDGFDDIFKKEKKKRRKKNAYVSLLLFLSAFIFTSTRCSTAARGHKATSQHIVLVIFNRFK
jgi:hypothetical protein